MANIFVSYAREDEQTAQKIYDSLVSEGHSVWMDRKKLVPGQEWEMEIEEAIQNSNIFIACLSTHSVNKVGFVQAELHRAMKVAERMPEGRIFIIPVRLDECEVPFKLRHLQWVNYFELSSGESLLRAVRSRSNVEKELEISVTEFLVRNGPEELANWFKGVAPSNLTKALIAIAKKLDELTSVRRRAARGLALLDRLDDSVWSEIIPTFSADMLQEWIPTWSEEDNATVLTAEHIRTMFEAKHLPNASTGFGLAVRKFIKRGAGYTSAVFLPGATYPKWAVKYDCVRSIISLDDEDSMRVLAAFSTMEYWKARERIIEYIAKKHEDGKLSDQDAQIEKGILNQIIMDGKTSEQTPTMTKARQTLQKLQENAAAE